MKTNCQIRKKRTDSHVEISLTPQLCGGIIMKPIKQTVRNYVSVQSKCIWTGYFRGVAGPNDWFAVENFNISDIHVNQTLLHLFIFLDYSSFVYLSLDFDCALFVVIEQQLRHCLTGWNQLMWYTWLPKWEACLLTWREILSFMYVHPMLLFYTLILPKLETLFYCEGKPRILCGNV